MTAEPAGSWLSVPVPSPGARLRLVALPCAGGGAVSFRAWGERLAPGAELVLVHLPGREARIREPPATSVDALVPPLVDALAAPGASPVVVFGHSMGALVAFEVARRLPGVAGLVVAGCRAPRLAEPRPLHDAPEERLVEELRRYGATPDELLSDADFLATFLPRLRADLRVAEAYRYSPGAPLRVPIVAFGADGDHSVGEPEIRAWAAETRGGFRFEAVTGGHFFPFEAPDFVDRLAATLAAL